MGTLFENHCAERLTSERPFSFTVFKCFFLLKGPEVLTTTVSFSYFFPILAPRLHGERAADPAAVHRHSWRQAAEAPRLLPGPPYHREDGVHPEPRGHAQQHQSPGDPTAAREQHEGHVSFDGGAHQVRLSLKFRLKYLHVCRELKLCVISWNWNFIASSDIPSHWGGNSYQVSSNLRPSF